MVLQRDMVVPVWGDADPGEKVEVSFSGQSKSAVADAGGKWMVKLDAMNASADGLEMSIKGKNTLTFSDVLVGEVWICSGQSNMQLGWNSVVEVRKKVPKAGNVRSFEVPRVVSYKEEDQLEGQWGTAVTSSAVGAGFSMFLEESVGVPVGIIHSSWGSSSLEAWMPRDMAQDFPRYAQQLEVTDADTAGKERITAALAAPERSKADDIFMRRQPNILYNAMIKPLVPYACRGLVWYQGERNAYNFDSIPDKPWYRRTIPMTGYGAALKGWVERYRKEWARDDMHFMVVMLPGYAGKELEKQAEKPDVESWAWMRQAQLEVLDLPHTSVANTIDLGHVTNIHPKDKEPIAERLALLAERDTLQRDVVAEGPIMQRVEQAGDHLVVHYGTSAQGLSTTDGAAPSGFWIADDSQRWVPAVATISSDVVELRSPDMAKPLYARYAFAAVPKVNLVNGAKLPARPFRTDSFTK